MSKGKLLVSVGTVLLVVFGVAGMVVHGGGPSAEAKYVGSTTCKKCHIAEHESWAQKKHAKTFERLTGAERKDPYCLKCHATGGGAAGGFISEDQTPALLHVGCEACHGPASEHVAAAKASLDEDEWDKKINKTPQTCVKCHSQHVDPHTKKPDAQKIEPAKAEPAKTEPTKTEK